MDEDFLRCVFTVFCKLLDRSDALLSADNAGVMGKMLIPKEIYRKTQHVCSTTVNTNMRRQDSMLKLGGEYEVHPALAP